MSGHWKEVVRLRLKGERYKEPALDLSALKKLSQFQKMVEETAQELWRAAHPDRERLPPHFEERTRLYLRKIEDGSTTAPLEIYIEEDKNLQTSFLDPEPKEVEEAVNIAYEVFEAISEGTQLPDSFPKALIPTYSKWALEIEEGMELEIEVPDKKPIQVTPSNSEGLSIFSEVPYEDHINIKGEVLEVDVRQKHFQLWIDEKTKVLVKFSEDQEAEVTNSLKEHKSLRMEVIGRGNFSPDGKILGINQIDEMKISPVGEIAFDRSAKPISKILAELSKDVPQEDWEKLPKDLSENLDHYIYGTPKK